MLNKKIVLNLKEFSTLEYFIALDQTLTAEHKNIFVCPALPFMMHDTVLKLGKKISLCAQNINDKDGTGMIRGQYIASCGYKYALCGHRDHAADLQKQIDECTHNGINPIVFIERLDQITDPEFIYVYEPHNAIGQDDADDVENIGLFVHDAKKLLEEPITVLYGGSVNAKNASEILRITDGVCLGRASRDIGQVVEIMAFAS